MIGNKKQMSRFLGYSENAKTKKKPIIMLHCYKDCNIDCPDCFVRHKPTYCAFDYGEIISDATLKKLVSIAKKHHMAFFSASGEPFLHWDDFTYPKLLPLVEKNKIPFLLTTNGFWGDNDKIIDQLISVYTGTLMFSVDWEHKVPLEKINHAIDRLADPSIKTQIYVGQMTDKDHPLGHIKTHHWDELYVKQFTVDNSNQDSDEINKTYWYHTKEGDLFRCNI